MATRKTTRRRGPRPRVLVLVGGGGHAVVVGEAAELAGWRVGGFVDDEAHATAGEDYAWLGTLLAEPSKHAGAARIVCVGSVGVRRRVINACGEATWGTVIHPSAWVSASVRVGRGVFVGPHAVVHSRAEVGDHAIINTGAIVEHDCVIGENAHVAPGAVVAGACRVGRDVLVGVGSRVIPKVAIGDGAVVGAGAVVLRDVGAGATVVGVPARSQDGR